MKILTPLIFVLLISGCSESATTPLNAPDSLKEMQERIEANYRDSNAQGIIDLLDRTDVPSALIKISEKFVVMGSESHTEVSSTVYSTDEFTPEVDLPGEYKGKKLRYNFDPSHWIVLIAEPNPNPSNSRVELIYPVFERNGQYFMSGGTWK